MPALCYSSLLPGKTCSYFQLEAKQNQKKKALSSSKFIIEEVKSGKTFYWSCVKSFRCAVFLEFSYKRFKSFLKYLCSKRNEILQQVTPFFIDMQGELLFSYQPRCKTLHTKDIRTSWLEKLLVLNNVFPFPLGSAIKILQIFNEHGISQMFRIYCHNYVQTKFWLVERQVLEL